MKNLSGLKVCALGILFREAVSRVWYGSGRFSPAWGFKAGNLKLLPLNEEGYNVTQCNTDVPKKCNILFLCVKPHIVDVVAAEIHPFLTTNHLVISVAAAVKISHLTAMLHSPCRVVRCMPNTCVTVSAGTCAISRGPNVDADDVELVMGLLGSIGICEEVSEGIMDTVCGLSGSGPAYVFLVIQGMADGAVKMGMPRQLALKFAAQTVMVSAPLCHHSISAKGGWQDGPGERLPTRRSSRTMCAPRAAPPHTASRPSRGRCVRAAFAEAVEAATRRGQELGRKIEAAKNPSAAAP
ncbi:hypothetical protein HPB48_019111 [Haemaphysalis longicornis]|uniref:Pyrroline-5-carboxylate reductase 3 n=1 Tax=Haemaphysalis longicornis TaxID=44386 RepID=A0A9J6GDX3_HAELO|nr:hypothetical protein HPB48_019111 [Haemaphysalis longicornis]